MKFVVVLLVVLLGLGVAADRVGVHVAERLVAEQVADQADLAGPPTVDIEGVPFLTQAFAGTYDDVRIDLTAQQLGMPEGTTAQVSLHGVHVPLSDLIDQSVTEVPVDRIDGTARLPYALIAAELGGDARVSRAGDGLQVSRTVQVLGFDVPLAGSGTVTLDGQDLVVRVEHASVVGVDVPDFVVDRVQGLLDLRYPVPELPFGLQLVSLQVADSGVDVVVLATDTVLR